MEEDIEYLDSEVKEHDGIIGKGYFFFRRFHIVDYQLD